MREVMQNYCNDFIYNKKELKDVFRWDSNYMVPVCANVLTAKGVKTNKDNLQKCKSLVEKKTGIFSYFHGNVKLPMAAMLAASGNPEGKMERTLALYDELKTEFHASTYLPIAASVLAEMVPSGSVESYIRRGKEIYKRMKNEHPFLTSAEDSVFAVLLAFSEKNDDELVMEMEACFKALKSSLRGEGNSIQTLSQVLALVDGDWNDKCKKVERIYDMLEKSGRKYSRYYELAVLGVASLLPIDEKELVAEILEVDSFLSNKEGYGFFGIDKKTRLMHATMLVTGSYSDASVPGNASVASITGTLAMLAAEEAAMCAIIASTAATAAATN